MAIAVICEQWRNGPEVLDTFIQVTTPAQVLISKITDRMPATLPSEHWPMWLGEMEAPLSTVKSVLPTYEDGGTWTTTGQPVKPRPSKAKTDQQSLF